MSAVEVGPGLDVHVVQGEEEQLHLLEDVPVVGRGGAQESHLSKEGGSQSGGWDVCFLQKCHFFPESYLSASVLTIPKKVRTTDIL